MVQSRTIDTYSIYIYKLMSYFLNCSIILRILTLFLNVIKYTGIWGYTSIYKNIFQNKNGFYFTHPPTFFYIFRYIYGLFKTFTEYV